MQLQKPMSWESLEMLVRALETVSRESERLRNWSKKRDKKKEKRLERIGIKEKMIGEVISSIFD